MARRKKVRLRLQVLYIAKIIIVMEPTTIARNCQCNHGVKVQLITSQHGILPNMLMGRQDSKSSGGSPPWSHSPRVSLLGPLSKTAIMYNSSL